MKRRGVFALMLAGVVMSLPGCGVAGERLPDYRYRLTVEVDTPQGIRTGSSVIQVASSVASKLALSPGKVSNQIKGEAVTVNLPGGQVLVALLSRPNSVAGARYYAFEGILGRTWDGPKDYIRQLNTLVKRHDLGVLQPTAYPALLTLRDIRDPTTVSAVDPLNFEKSFGKGIKLRKITVQITHDEITTGIEQRLPWLVAMSRGGSLGGRGPFNYENRALNYGYIDFKREL